MAITRLLQGNSFFAILCTECRELNQHKTAPLLHAWPRQAPCEEGVLGSDNLLPHARATVTVEEQVTREHQAQQKNRRRSLRSAASDGPSMSSSNKRGKTSSDMTEARLLPMHCLLSKCFCSISVDHFGTESRIFLTLVSFFIVLWLSESPSLAPKFVYLHQKEAHRTADPSFVT